MKESAPRSVSGGRAWPAVVLILAAVGLAFHGASRGEFLLWDDDINLTGNPHLQNGLTAESVRWMFTDAAYMRRYVPFAWLGWAIERSVTGLTAASAHTGNVIFHALNAVLGMTAYLRSPSTPGNQVAEGEESLAQRYRRLYFHQPPKCKCAA